VDFCASRQPESVGAQGVNFPPQEGPKPARSEGVFRAPRPSSNTLWHVRYLAIDLGDKRTGLAVGDTITGMVSPAGVLEIPVSAAGGDELLRALAKAVDEHLGPSGELVLGLPINMDGTEGPRAKAVRQFAARIGERCARVVHFQDERLTSAAADWSMARSGMTHKEKKSRRDAIAAAAILSDFLAGLKGQ
jgi:putative holliday junction resolvase